MHRQNPARLGRAGVRESCRIHVESPCVGLHEHRDKPRRVHGQHCRDVRIRGNQNLVTRLEPSEFDGGAEHQRQRIETVPDAHAISITAIGGKVLLEAFAIGASDIPAGFHNGSCRVLQGIHVGRVHLFQVEKGNLHHASPSACEPAEPSYTNVYLRSPVQPTLSLNAQSPTFGTPSSLDGPISR